ncbi:flavin monoamine oxidase family protein [Hugenholtzia roseola]|uniref:flavin monoamine oxidase family protein n=1 Tax=Hugenholtzia roseola TaxID=1002 RepID=UPI0003F72001|nr:NAD(P)/FAD-dependent oxidoreductase [Hugenholtzia roseola]
MKNPKKVIVVGAGAAGLYLACLLKEADYEVTVLEADGRVGGRIYSLLSEGQALELGAEFVHGSSHILYDFCVKNKIKLYPEGETFFVYQEKVQSLSDLEKQPLIADLVRDFLEFYQGHHLYKGEEISAFDFIKNTVLETHQEKEWEKVLPYYEAFAGMMGTSLRHLGMKAWAMASNRWSAGDENYRLALPYQDFLAHMVDFLEENLHLNKVVRHISYQEQTGAEVITEQGERFWADAVALTVPLSILKEKFITFNPILPERKAEAIEKIGFEGAGIKVVMQFKVPFWEAQMDALIGATVAQEYWVSSFQKPNCQPTLTAFVMGDKALNMSKLEDKEKLSLLLEELDTLFRKENQTPPSKHLEAYFVCDWAKKPYIKGAYSYPSPHSHFERHHLAAAVGERLFFAGEATHTGGHFATVFGALETAERAFEEINSFVKKSFRHL